MLIVFREEKELEYTVRDIEETIRDTIEWYKKEKINKYRVEKNKNMLYYMNYV